MINFTVDKSRCVKCGECVEDCPRGIIGISDEYPAIIPGREGECIRCQLVTSNMRLVLTTF